MIKVTIKYTGFMKAVADGDKAAVKKMLEECALEQLKKQQLQKQEPPQQQNPQTSSISSKWDKNLTPILRAVNAKRESNGFFRAPLSRAVVRKSAIRRGLSLLAPWLEEGKLDAVTKFLLCLAGLINPRRWRRR